MSLSTLQLLALPQRDAVLDMVEDSLIESVTMNDVTVEDGFIRSDGRTGVSVRSSEARVQDPTWPYYGTTVFSHRRMNLADFFAGIDLRLKVPPSASGGIDTTSNQIVERLSTIFQVHFDPQDYYSDAIQGPGSVVYRLNATPLSLRWTGGVDIHIFPDLENSHD